MKEKTLGEVAQDSWNDSHGSSKNRWKSVAAAVIAEHERRKWKLMATLPNDGRVVVGYWYEDEWVQCMGMAYMLSHFPEYTHWQYAPEGPKP